MKKNNKRSMKKIDIVDIIFTTLIVVILGGLLWTAWYVVENKDIIYPWISK